MPSADKKTSQRAARGRTRLEGGRVVDVARGAYMPAGTTVVIEGDRIAAIVGPGEAGGGSADEKVIQLQGRALMPSFFNTHCHLQLVIPHMIASPCELWAARQWAERQREHSLAECVQRGVTQVRDAWTESLCLNRDLVRKIASGALIGPHVHQAVVVSQRGGTFAGARPLSERVSSWLLGMPVVDYASPDSGVVVFAAGANEMAVRDAVNRAIDERGAHTIKIYEQHEKKITYKPGATLMTMAQLQALTDQARRRGVPTAMHHVSAESFRRGAQAGVTSMAHTLVQGELSDADIRAFVGAGCILEPTLSLAYDLFAPKPGDKLWDHPRARALSALRVSTYAKFANDYWLPCLAKANEAGFARQERGCRRLMGLIDMSHVYEFFAPLLFSGMDAARRVIEAGGRFACANDAGAVARTPAMLELELVMLDFCLRQGTGEGLSGALALRGATLHSAQALGQEAAYGSIAVGMMADLVVLAGDVLADWKLLGTRAAAVFMDGKLIVNNCGL